VAADVRLRLTTFLLAALGVGIAGGSLAVGITYVSKWYPTVMTWWYYTGEAVRCMTSSVAGRPRQLQ
jgi:hypothetical protein